MRAILSKLAGPILGVLWLTTTISMGTALYIINDQKDDLSEDVLELTESLSTARSNNVALSTALEEQNEEIRKLASEKETLDETLREVRRRNEEERLATTERVNDIIDASPSNPDNELESIDDLIEDYFKDDNE